jgi:hypothetical protein
MRKQLQYIENEFRKGDAGARKTDPRSLSSNRDGSIVDV